MELIARLDYSDDLYFVDQDDVAMIVLTNHVYILDRNGYLHVF